jgi:DNA modification methylase
VTLRWAGRTFEPGAALPAKDATFIEHLRGSGTPQRLFEGDALAVLGALQEEAGSFDLAYVDPPYASGADYHVAEAAADGRGQTRRTKAYEDTWREGDGGIGAYLDHLAPRLDGMARLLAKNGTLWVHVDWRANYLLRVILDEIFGPRGFRNEIIWKRAPNLGRQAKSGQFGRTLDTLLVYGHAEARLLPPLRREPIAASHVRFDEEGRPFTTAPRGDYTDASIERLAEEGRILRAPSGRVYVKYFVAEGPDGSYVRERPVDTLWNDIAPLRHRGRAEKTGYPTQKPRELLERVLLAGSAPGGKVLDLFSGSGTTLAAAHALGRAGTGGDRSIVALAHLRARAAREGFPLAIAAAEPIARPPLAATIRTTKTSATVTVPAGGRLLFVAARNRQGELGPFVTEPGESMRVSTRSARSVLALDEHGAAAEFPLGAT